MSELQAGTEFEEDGIWYRRTSMGVVKLCEGTIVREGKEMRCRSASIKGQQYCPQHGMKHMMKAERPQALAHAYQKHRRRFKSIGKELLEKVDDYREDPDLFSLRDDTAYLTALLDKRAEAAAEGVSIEQYRRIEAAYNLCRSKLGSPDFIDCFEQLGESITQRLDEFAASKDVLDLIERRTDLVEAEQRMMQTKSYVLEADQAFMLIMQVVEVVKSCVRNADELTAIKTGINKLLKSHKQDTEESIEDAVIVDER